jgi:starvation-inducible DNA-binding protein
MEPKIGLTKKALETSINNLNVVLANTTLLYIKTRKFHWNVSGNSFMELHKLFESQYTELESVIDEIAERIVKLGGKAVGTMAEYIKLSILKEVNDYPNQKKMLTELLDDNEKVITQLRKFIETADSESNDVGTADFLTGLVQMHESHAWMLRKYNEN